MDIKINLVSKGRRATKSKGVVVTALIVTFIVLVLAFLSSVIFVTYKIYSLKREINEVSLEAVGISSEIRSNNEVVNRYVLTKSVLDYAFNIDNAKFHYKKYLDEIVAVLPANLVLRGVDFQTKGWVSVAVEIPDLTSLRNFEDRITDTTILEQTVFSSIFSEGIVKEKSGAYLIKLQFELKKNV